MTATNLLAMPLLSATISTGTNEDWLDAIKYVVQEETGTIDTWPQLDLRGITFEMEIRRNAADHEVILSASTVDGTLAIGAPPDFGFLVIHVPYTAMKYTSAGDYVGDVRATDWTDTRVVLQFQLQIFEGVTKSP